MSRDEKIYYLKTHHQRAWELACIARWGRLTGERTRNCVCGKPIVEGHIGSCRVFSRRVDTLALEDLSHLLPSEIVYREPKNDGTWGYPVEKNLPSYE